MVLGVDGQMVLLRIRRDAPRHGPADEDAVAFEPQVPVHAGGVVLLDHEPGQPLVGRHLLGTRWLRGCAEVAHLLVTLELLPGLHGSSLPAGYDNQGPWVGLGYDDDNDGGARAASGNSARRLPHHRPARPAARRPAGRAVPAARAAAGTGSA